MMLVPSSSALQWTAPQLSPLQGSGWPGEARSLIPSGLGSGHRSFSVWGAARSRHSVRCSGPLRRGGDPELCVCARAPPPPADGDPSQPRENQPPPPPAAPSRGAQHTLDAAGAECAETPRGPLRGASNPEEPGGAEAQFPQWVPGGGGGGPSRLASTPGPGCSGSSCWGRLAEC